MKNFDAYETLLIEFEKLENGKETLPTFLEISGFPHFENVISNILAFYFDSNESHGHDAMLLFSLLQAAGIKNLEDNSEKLKTIEVNREWKTLNDNYIDIVIETDDFIVAIENKIYASLYNPLNDYKNSIKAEAAKKNKEPIYILLTLLNKTYSEKELKGFNHITYKNLFEECDRNLSLDYKKENKYQVYFQDLKQTIINMSRINLNDDFIKFIKDNHKIINQFQKDVFRKFEKFAKNELSKMKTFLQPDIVSEFHFKIETKKDRLEAVSFYRFKHELLPNNSKINLEIKVRIRPDQWRIEIWDDGTDKSKRLKPFLDKLNISYKTKSGLEEDTGPARYFFLYKNYDFETDPIEIYGNLQDLIHKILNK